MINTQAIKQRMKELDITQTMLSEALGIAPPTVSQKINNVRPMFIDEAEIIAYELKIPDADFCSYFFHKEIA